MTRRTRSGDNGAAFRKLIDTQYPSHFCGPDCDHGAKVLVPGQKIPLQLSAVEPGRPETPIVCRVICRDCGTPMAMVCDVHDADGELLGRKLIVNGGHALLDDSTIDHEFAVSCIVCEGDAHVFPGRALDGRDPTIRPSSRRRR